MKFYKIAYTDKFPFKYFIESSAYAASITNEQKYNDAVQKIKDAGIIEFTSQQIIKLEMAGFTVMKKA